ncbi:hypothetical protein FZEAL_3895 [Fusarium zealandicum]|uniref:Uncharacterized protein n=1 Tax=Fusarium zealandicum TaxID=1053134 RepID=A0A8H4XMG3_9HYPO|nr:hypothetical protein FZEAL_3895 [Fusarium zealandicum]
MPRQPTAISTNQPSSSSPSDAPISPSAQAGADRCMRHTNSWTPDTASFERRQSWSSEDRKHQLHMEKIGHVSIGPGFSERAGA